VVIGGVAAVAALGVGAVGVRMAGSGSRPEPLPQAKTLFDRAVTLRQYDISANGQALAYLREAVRLSPDYGEAWGALALAYRTALLNEAPERTAGFEERLIEAVRHAERHDPGNGDAAAALLPHSMFGRWSELEPIYRSAIRRNPDHPAGYSLLGSLLMDVGRWSDAVPVLRAAAARTPASPLYTYKLVVALWSAGQLSAAEDEISRAMQLWPQRGPIWQTRIKLLALSGRAREALALASDAAAKPLDDKDAGNQSGRLLFLTALATRSAADADRAVEDIIRQAREVELDRLTAALQAGALGRTDLALDMVEGVFLGRGQWRLQQTRRNSLSTHPLFQPHARPLWNQQRFIAILESVGLERYWRSAGSLPDYRRTQ
jgi:tetratricopeptide (TPR) repeat protein